MFFLESPCFFYDPTNFGNLISGPSTFSKPSLYIWKLSVHILLKPSLKDFGHYLALASMWMRAIVQQFEHPLALPFFGTGMKFDLFQSCGHCWVFQIYCHVECKALTASSFRIWNSSTGIPSPLLGFVHSNAPCSTLDSPLQDSWLEVSDRTIMVIGAITIYFCIVLPCILVTSS